MRFFYPSKGRFIVQDLVGEVSLGAVDVECILALENHGLSAEGILGEEGEDVKDRVPPQFLSKTTGNIVIDDLIVDITKNKSADDDFLRRVVLVLLGTVLAPMSSKTVPKQYYALVDDVKRISKILLECVHPPGSAGLPSQREERQTPPPMAERELSSPAGTPFRLVPLQKNMIANLPVV